MVAVPSKPEVRYLTDEPARLRPLTPEELARALPGCLREALEAKPGRRAVAPPTSPPKASAPPAKLHTAVASHSQFRVRLLAARSQRASIR